MKLLTIVGTRPELIKLSEVIKKFDTFTEHILAHTGQNYDFELNEIFYSDLGLRRPDYYMGVASESLGETIGGIIESSYSLIQKVRPDGILIYGDTNSCLSAICAKRLKVPVFHFEAGNRSFDENIPEEINRRIVDHVSDINFVLTEHARTYLIREGLRPDRIIKTGGFMREILAVHRDKIASSSILRELSVISSEYFVVSLHREENVDVVANLIQIMDSLAYLGRQFGVPVLFSLHPRTRRRLEEFRIGVDQNIRLLRPLSFTDYIALQREALCVISDSGSVTEEADILGFSAVTPRQSHERPEGFDEGVLIMSGFSQEAINNAVRVQIALDKGGRARKVDDYQGENTSSVVVKAILSYVDYVNRNVWRKDRALEGRS